MNFETINGWSLLASDDDRKLAKLWLCKVYIELTVEQVGLARSSCIRAEIDQKNKILHEFQTAYAVKLGNGQIVCGIAPTSRSAACRSRKLLRHGHCIAAGVR